MDLFYRRLGSFDVASLPAIHRACFAEEGWKEEAFLSLLLNPCLGGWICEEQTSPDNPSLLGFILTQRVLEEAEILTFAVTPSHQRQGIGRTLLSLTLKDLSDQGVETLWLEAAVSNEKALNLYQSLGFVAVKKRVGYYQHLGESAYMLKCDLTDKKMEIK